MGIAVTDNTCTGFIAKDAAMPVVASPWSVACRKVYSQKRYPGAAVFFCYVRYHGYQRKSQDTGCFKGVQYTTRYFLQTGRRDKPPERNYVRG